MECKTSDKSIRKEDSTRGFEQISHTNLSHKPLTQTSHTNLGQEHSKRGFEKSIRQEDSTKGLDIPKMRLL
jgi:hypothetical protein